MRSSMKWESEFHRGDVIERGGPQVWRQPIVGVVLGMFCERSFARRGRLGDADERSRLAEGGNAVGTEPWHVGGAPGPVLSCCSRLARSARRITAGAEGTIVHRRGLISSCMHRVAWHNSSEDRARKEKKNYRTSSEGVTCRPLN